MSKPAISTKRLAISRANAQMVLIIGAASFVTVFCLVASNAVLKQNQYQSRVTASKEKANRDLQDNLETFTELEASYKKFDNSGTNIIGGARSGNTDRDGSNSKIILDALPRTYDFPAVTSSVEKILRDGGFMVTSLGGTDDEIAQQAVKSSPSPEPITIPFTFTVEKATYDSVNKLLLTLDRSVRPIHIDKVSMKGGNTSLEVKVTGHTYFQAGKDVNIETQVQK
jgi:hypothetical protein